MTVLRAGAESLVILALPTPCRCGRMAALFVHHLGRSRCLACATKGNL